MKYIGLFVIVIILMAAIVYLYLAPLAHFEKAANRVQYGNKLRPVIDVQTIIDDTIPDGREGVLYREKYATPDMYEKNKLFLEVISGGIQLPKLKNNGTSATSNIATSLTGGVRTNQQIRTFAGMPCNGNMQQTSGVPVPDMTPDPGLDTLPADHYLVRSMKRPANFILKDPFTSLEKREGLAYYMSIKKGDLTVPYSFGGA